MANVQGLASSFKSEILMGYHQLGAATIVSRGSLTSPTVDTIKAALFLASASITAATTAYSTTGELAGSGNYTQGGVTVTNATAPTTSGTGAIWTPSASFSWTNLTSSGSFDCVQIYNSTQSNRTISVHTFGAQSVTAGNFTLSMPVNATGTALVQIT